MKKQKQKNQEPQQELPVSYQEILTWLQQVKFKKTLFGGVDEADVWKKIGELTELYEKALIAERAKAAWKEDTDGE